MMKTALFVLLLVFAPSIAAAYPHDAQLSAKLKKEFEAEVGSTTAGRELYARLEKAGPGYAALRVLVRRDASDCFAWFDPSANAVYFNSRFILKFFAAKGFKDPQVVEVLWNNKKVRAELVKYANPIFLHELVHAGQCYLYPEYRKDAGGNPLEFEYEAYLTEDMYVHERMKADPRLLRDFIRGAYTDLYTANIFGSYFNLSLDPEQYKEKIRRYYEDGVGGYVSLEKAETTRRNGLEDSKILGYASGDLKDYKGDNSSLVRLKAQKEEYASFLKGFYDSRWPAFSADALSFVGNIALEEKNYPLALDCLAVADVNSAGSGLPAEALAALKTKGAVAVLEAASFIRDNSKKMGLELLSQHLKALEKACLATVRPFPEDLDPLRDRTYRKAVAFYARKYGAEKDPSRRDYYKESLDYFAARSGPAEAGK